MFVTEPVYFWIFFCKIQILAHLWVRDVSVHDLWLRQHFILIFWEHCLQSGDKGQLMPLTISVKEHYTGAHCGYIRVIYLKRGNIYRTDIRWCLWITNRLISSGSYSLKYQTKNTETGYLTLWLVCTPSFTCTRSPLTPPRARGRAPGSPLTPRGSGGTGAFNRV